MTMIASGTRISAVTILRSMSSGARAIERLAHFLAGLEERHRLLFHRDVGAGARVATGPRRPFLRGECPAGPRLHPAAAPQRRYAVAEDGVADAAWGRRRIAGRAGRHEPGVDPCGSCPGPDGRIRPPFNSGLKGAKGPRNAQG